MPSILAAARSTVEPGGQIAFIPDMADPTFSGLSLNVFVQIVSLNLSESLVRVGDFLTWQKF
jgi:hypothetical protein